MVSPSPLSPAFSPAESNETVSSILPGYANTDKAACLHLPERYRSSADSDITSNSLSLLDHGQHLSILKSDVGVELPSNIGHHHSDCKHGGHSQQLCGCCHSNSFSSSPDDRTSTNAQCFRGNTSDLVSNEACQINGPFNRDQSIIHISPANASCVNEVSAQHRQDVGVILGNQECDLRAHSPTCLVEQQADNCAAHGALEREFDSTVSDLGAYICWGLCTNVAAAESVTVNCAYGQSTPTVTLTPCEGGTEQSSLPTLSRCVVRSPDTVFGSQCHDCWMGGESSPAAGSDDDDVRIDDADAQVMISADRCGNGDGVDRCLTSGVFSERSTMFPEVGVSAPVSLSGVNTFMEGTTVMALSDAEPPLPVLSPSALLMSGQEDELAGSVCEAEPPVSSIHVTDGNCVRHLSQIEPGENEEANPTKAVAVEGVDELWDSIYDDNGECISPATYCEASFNHWMLEL